VTIQYLRVVRGGGAERIRLVPRDSEEDDGGERTTVWIRVDVLPVTIRPWKLISHCYPTEPDVGRAARENKYCFLVPPFDILKSYMI